MPPLPLPLLLPLSISLIKSYRWMRLVFYPSYLNTKSLEIIYFDQYKIVPSAYMTIHEIKM